MKFDTLVLGSGVSGLTAAALLAKQGQKVAIIEKQPSMAPLIRTFKRKNFLCEPAFHYTGGLEDNGILSLLFRYLEVDKEITPVPYKPECYDRLESEEFEPLDLPYGFSRITEYLTGKFPGSADGIENYFKTVQEIRSRDFIFNTDLKYGSFPDELTEHISVNDFLSASGVEKPLREAIGRYGRALYGVTGDKMPFGLHSLIMGSFYHNTYAIKGGGTALVKAFEKALDSLGVTVYTSSKVQNILAENRQFKGIETEDGKAIYGDNAICSFHPQSLLEKLPREQMRPAFFNRVSRMENSCAFSVTFFGMEKEDTPEELKYNNIYRFKSLLSGEDEDLAIINNQAEDLDTIVDEKRAVAYISYHKNNPFHPGLSKEKYNALKQEMEERHCMRFFRRFPELHGKAFPLETCTPLSYERYTATPGGAMYGLAQSIHQRNIGYRVPLGSLYLCGQSIIPGVLGAIVTSVLACGQIIPMEPVWERIVKCRV